MYDISALGPLCQLCPQVPLLRASGNLSQAYPLGAAEFPLVGKNVDISHPKALSILIGTMALD